MTDNTVTLTSDDSTAVALVATIRAAVNGRGKYAAYVTAHAVTRETVKDHAFALAVFAYPTLPTVQKKDGIRTKFGNAVQAAGFGLRSALDKDETDETVTDYLARVVKAAEVAHKHEVTADAILAAITAALS